METTVRMNHLDALKWLDTNRIGKCTPELTGLAAECGHFKIVKCLYEKKNKEPYFPPALVEALRNGHLRIAYWLSRKDSDHGVNMFPMIFSLNTSWPMIKALEILLFLNEVYPEVLTPSRIDAWEEYSCFDAWYPEMVLSWLNDNFPTTDDTSS
ncbi:unnamed protein product [Phytophthora lilii]|uniref:Unnamed protein product n=1 Tax=Phytophthora lilii TaxID=2077276 RepID=A0A9W6WPX6_9STRA|nr:unnamed protein product [Phytophthora lilii]